MIRQRKQQAGAPTWTDYLVVKKKVNSPQVYDYLVIIRKDLQWENMMYVDNIGKINSFPLLRGT
jgi:hypothetical protein